MDLIELIEDTYADELQDMLEGAKSWPPPGESEIYEEIRKWAAFRDADSEVLKPNQWGSDRDYLVSPLPSRIAGAKSDLVFGEDPEFTAANEADQDTLDALVASTQLPSELQFGERICASEGEVWWKAYVEPTADFPLIEFVSRLYVVPLLSGPTVLAVAFCSELDRQEDDPETTTWRHVEIRSLGYARNLLYRATPQVKGLGDLVALTEHVDTAELAQEWTHGLDSMLCGRILNTKGPDPAAGVSDYESIEDLLFALNEVQTIGQENVRLVGKKKVVVPQRFLDQHGNFPAGAEVILATEVDQDPDKPGQGVQQVEFRLDAAELKTWKDDLKDEALEGSRTAPQLLGRHTEGAQTGPALRARLLDSILDAHGKGRHWDAQLPEGVRALQMIDALPEEDGGLGNDWKASSEAPSIERQSILPEDPSERSQRLGQEVGSLLKSRRTAIREAHPDWSEDQVDEEMDQIDEENTLPEVPA